LQKHTSQVKRNVSLVASLYLGYPCWQPSRLKVVRRSSKLSSFTFKL